MGRLSNLRVVDPVLTNLSVGYSNADLVGDVLFPFVPVDKEGGKIPKFGKKLQDLQHRSALRAKSNRINPEDVDSSPSSRRARSGIPERTTARATSRLPSRSARHPRLTEGIRLRHEKR
jgi:hypothetical protein